MIDARGKSRVAIEMKSDDNRKSRGNQILCRTRDGRLRPQVEIFLQRFLLKGGVPRFLFLKMLIGAGKIVDDERPRAQVNEDQLFHFHKINALKAIAASD